MGLFSAISRRPALGLVEQLIGRHDRVHQTPSLGGRRVVQPAQVPDLPRPLLADHPCQIGGTETGVEGADLRAGLPEPGGLGGDAQVAEHVQHVPAADGDAVDGGDDRLGDVPDQLVQVADLEHAALGGPVVPGLRPLLDVTAGAERLLPLAGQDHHLHRLVGPRQPEGLDQLLHRPTTERVVPVRPVDRDHPDGPVDLVPDVLERLRHARALPLHCAWRLCVFE